MILGRRSKMGMRGPNGTGLEQLLPLQDDKAGLSGFIAIHSTRLGPAAGGCRLWHYPTLEAARADAVRLAEGMSYKNALAGLPLGGGKAVLCRPPGPYDRERLFEAFARAVATLGGDYVTAEDVGTTVEDMTTVAGITDHVAGLSAAPGCAGGDPSPWTALGVKIAMEKAAGQELGKSLSELTVIVQGLGNVGYALCQLLHAEGARLIVAEQRADVAARAAAAFGAEVAHCGTVLQTKADILAPCALGGVLDDETVGKLRVKLICGAANNQLARPEVGDALAARGIVYAPDYVVNAGGIINVAAEYLGWSPETVGHRVAAIGDRLLHLLDLARDTRVGTNRVADDLARSVIANGQDVRPAPAVATAG